MLSQLNRITGDERVSQPKEVGDGTMFKAAWRSMLGSKMSNCHLRPRARDAYPDVVRRQERNDIVCKRMQARSSQAFLFMILAAAQFATRPLLATELEERTGEVAYSLAWIDCAESQPPAFVVEVNVSGEFWYLDSQFARIVDRGMTRLNTSQRRQLLRASEQLATARNQTGLSRSTGGDTPMNEALCLRTISGSLERRRQSLILIAPVERSPKPSLVQQIERLLDTKKRVCPLLSRGRDLVASKQGYCEPPLLSLQIPEPRACFSYRAIDVYADGTVRQKAEVIVPKTLDSNATREFLDDTFTQLSPEAVVKLWTEANGLPPWDPLPQGASEPRVQLRGNTQDHQVLAKKIAAGADMKWIDIVERADCGGSNGHAASILAVRTKIG